MRSQEGPRALGNRGSFPLLEAGYLAPHSSQGLTATPGESSPATGSDRLSILEVFGSYCVAEGSQDNGALSLCTGDRLTDWDKVPVRSRAGCGSWSGRVGEEWGRGCGSRQPEQSRGLWRMEDLWKTHLPGLSGPSSMPQLLI